MHFYRSRRPSGGPEYAFLTVQTPLRTPRICIFNNPEAPQEGQNMHFLRLGGGGVSKTILERYLTIFDDI